MRICLYTGSALPKLGGQEAVVDALARHLQRLGHEPTVFAPRPRLPLRARDGELPYPVVRHPRFYSTHHLVGWYRTFLLRAHRRHRFDVVHCHDVYPTGYVAALCKPTTRLPLVITSHGGDIRPGNARLAKPGLRGRFDLTIDAADALVSIGRFTTDAFLALGATAAQLVDLPNGVDLTPFARATPRPADLDPAVRPDGYALFLGRLAIRKGLDTLLDAMALLPPTADRLRLVIAGSGDERAEVERRIAALRLGERVRLVGRVGGDAKNYLLQNARCVVMPSRGWEAAPLVVLEGYAAGTPVVGTRIPGLADVIDDGRTGLLVSPESPADLAAALGRMWADPRAAAAMGDAARGTAAGYGWDAIAARHVAVYERVRHGPID